MQVCFVVAWYECKNNFLRSGQVLSQKGDKNSPVIIQCYRGDSVKKIGVLVSYFENGGFNGSRSTDCEKLKTMLANEIIFGIEK